jgi:hypothetical protein
LSRSFLNGVVGIPLPTLRDMRAYIVRPLGKLARPVLLCRLKWKWGGRCLSLDDAVPLGQRGSGQGPVFPVGEMASLGLILALAGELRRHSFGRAPRALAMQQPPSLLSTYCNHDSSQCDYFRGCSTFE